MISIASEVEKFNQVLGRYLNNRRVWNNGKIEIFYNNRVGDGRWVISNGSYNLINDGTQIVLESINHSIPGNNIYHILALNIYHILYIQAI